MNEKDSQKIPDTRVDRRRHKRFKFFVLIKLRKRSAFDVVVRVHFTPSATKSMVIVTENRCVRYQVIGTKVCTICDVRVHILNGLVSFA